jgi:hypothetical protein
MARITAENEHGGGAAELNADVNAWASYKIATVGDRVPAEIMYAGLTLPDGRAVQFFCNRDTRLIVVDLVARDGKGGLELLRVKV